MHTPVDPDADRSNRATDRFLAHLYVMSVMGVVFVALARYFLPEARRAPFGCAAWAMIELTAAIYVASHGLCALVCWLSGNGADEET